MLARAVQLSLGFSGERLLDETDHASRQPCRFYAADSDFCIAFEPWISVHCLADRYNDYISRLLSQEYASCHGNGLFFM